MVDDVAFLDWSVELLDGGELVQKPLSEIDLIPRGTEFSTFGVATSAGYLYLVEVGNAQITVLYTDRCEDAGAELRLPIDGSRFSAPFDGELRVFSAPSPIGAEDWAALFPGREPLPRNRTGAETSTPKPKPKQQPKTPDK
jgi:hypothetical protein